MKVWVSEYEHTDFGNRVEGVYRPKRLQDEGWAGHRHTEFRERVDDGVYRPH